MSLNKGQIVEFNIKGNEIELGVVINNTAKGIRILQLNKKELVIHERNILHKTTKTKISSEDYEEIVAHVVKINENRIKLMENINLSDLHSLLVDEIRGYTLQELASYLGDSENEDFTAALLRVLFKDSIYFKYKKDLFYPSTLDEVRQLLEAESKKKKQQELENRLISELKSAFEQESLEGLSLASEEVKNIIQLAVYGTEANISKRKLEIYEKAGITNARNAFNWLVKVKEFSADEITDIIKYKVPTQFSSDIEQEASIITSDINNLYINRKDLTNLETFAIDAEGTRDRDDAFSLVKLAEGWKLYIHVSDVASVIHPNSLIDKEACKRATSIYLPDSVIPMLPYSLSENLLSLLEDSKRIALTWEIDFDENINIKKYEIYKSIVNVTHALSYDAADTMLECLPTLKDAYTLASKLKENRKKLNAIILERQPDIKFIKDDSGQIKLLKKSQSYITSKIVMEFMILANYIAANFCHINKIPCLYRTQEKPEIDFELPESFEPVKFYKAMKLFRRTVTSLDAKPHSTLGVEMYCQVTSPIRRYADLLIQRQIESYLENQAPIYNADQFMNIILQTDEPIKIADEIMNKRYNYWLLKYINQEIQNNKEKLWDGIIVDINQNDITIYMDEICEFRSCKKPDFNCEIGEQVLVKVLKSDPFDGVLKIDVVTKK